MAPDRRRDNRDVSPEEIAQIREQMMMEVIGREKSRAYMELLLSGSPDEEYDPSAVLGVFPVLSRDGEFTTDLVNFTKEGAGLEDDYLRKVAGLTLDGTDFVTDPGQSIEGMDVATQTVAMMRVLADSISPSAVLVFCGDRPGETSAHLFYPAYLPPSEALSQVKDVSIFGLEQHKNS